MRFVAGFNGVPCGLQGVGFGETHCRAEGLRRSSGTRGEHRA